MTVCRADRELPREMVERMVRLVRPDWRVRAASLVDDSVSTVYEVAVDGPTGARECVLKAKPGAETLAVGDVAAEARLLSVLREHTDIPVPHIFGSVDDANDVRTPFFLMDAMDGEKIPRAAVPALSERTLRRFARQSGRYLAQLHGVAVPNVETFGNGIQCERSPSLSGGHPPADPNALVFTDGAAHWPDLLEEWWAEDFERLADTQFADLVPDFRSTLADRIDELSGEFSPALARVDHGFHNLLVDREGGRITGVLDWGSLYALPPAYDLALVELHLAGGSWLTLPEVPDRRSLIREALLAGYEHERPLPRAFDRQRECYQLALFLAWMTSLGDDLSGRAVPADRLDDAAAGFRSLVEPLMW